MPHMVIFRSMDGKPGYHQAEALEEAVRFVERLRNSEQVTEARIFRMQEVPIEYKTYYKVEIAGGAEEPASAEHPEPTVGDEQGEPAAAAAGRFGRFGKS
jgi:hypothetical protein